MLQWNVVILLLQYLGQQNVIFIVRFCYKRSYSLLYLQFQEVNSKDIREQLLDPCRKLPVCFKHTFEPLPGSGPIHAALWGPFMQLPVSSKLFSGMEFLNRIFSQSFLA